MESWSEKYYPGLTLEQHKVNNDWFRKMLELLTDTGTLGVPNIRKIFNKQGEEIDDAK